MPLRAHADAVVRFYDGHPISERQILDKLALDGVPLAGLTEDVLQNYDQDHYGGVAFNDVLAEAAGIEADAHVLDLCSGMGGPARYLAHTRGCRVTGVDLTASRVAGARRLTALVGLADRVDFHCANALALPFPDQSFDVVVGQEAWAHVPDKSGLISEAVRVTRIGGRIAFSDILRRGALDRGTEDRLRAEMAFADLETREGYCALLEGAGCRVLAAEDLSRTWTTVLQDRLAMYRSLRDQTVARFGAAHFDKWDAAYAFFVGLYEAGELGGARIVARQDGG